MNYFMRACEISRDSRLRTSFVWKCVCIKQRNFRNSFWEFWSVRSSYCESTPAQRVFPAASFWSCGRPVLKKERQNELNCHCSFQNLCFQRTLTVLNTFQKGLRFHSLLAWCTPVLILLTIQQSLFLRAVSFLTRFPAFYGTQAFITGLTVAHRWSLFWAKRILPASYHRVSSRYLCNVPVIYA